MLPQLGWKDFIICLPFAWLAYQKFVGLRLQILHAYTFPLGSPARLLCLKLAGTYFFGAVFAAAVGAASLFLPVVTATVLCITGGLSAASTQISNKKRTILAEYDTLLTQAAKSNAVCRGSACETGGDFLAETAAHLRNRAAQIVEKQQCC